MRIDDSAGLATDTRSVQLDRTQETQQEGVGGRTRTEPAQGDRVSVSTLGLQVARAVQTPSAAEVARVEQAQRAEQNGGLQISDEDLAEALLQGAVRDTTLDAEIARLSQPER